MSILPAPSGPAGPLYLANLALTRIAPIATVASSEQAAFPATYATDLYYLPQRPWKATVTTDSWLRYQVVASSVTLVEGVFIGWLAPGGLSTFNLQFSTDPAFGTTQLDISVNIQNAYNPRTRRYAYAYFPVSLSTAYVRFFAPNHAGAPVELGQMVVLGPSGLSIPQRAPRPDTEKTTPTTENVAESGSTEVIVLGPPQMTYAFDWEWASNYILRDGEDTLLESPHFDVEPDESVLVVPDKTLLPHMAFLGLRNGTIAMRSPQGVGAQVPFGYREIV